MFTFPIMIAAKIMKKYEQTTKNHKTFDIFDQDCSENHETITNNYQKIQKIQKH